MSMCKRGHFLFYEYDVVMVVRLIHLKSMINFKLNNGIKTRNPMAFIQHFIMKQQAHVTY